jgi:hypothetical protein
MFLLFICCFHASGKIIIFAVIVMCQNIVVYTVPCHNTEAGKKYFEWVEQFICL